MPRAELRLQRLATAGYFFVSIVAALVLFVVVFGLLQDESEREAPYFSAGIAAAALLGLAAIAREIAVRRARRRLLLRQPRFDVLPARKKIEAQRKKFTLEQNTAALRLIEKRSRDADKTFDEPEKHFEVFKICREYLDLAEAELAKVHIGSPRLPALRHGQEVVQALHKKHLLQWAAQATRKQMREAAVLIEVNEKIAAAQRALEILGSALQVYPSEPQLIESATAVREFIGSIRVTNFIELAERAAFKGHNRRAIDHYGDALFYLSREQTANGSDYDLMRAKIEGEIERLRRNLDQKRVGNRE